MICFHLLITTPARSAIRLLGPIPSQLGQLTSLQRLSLRRNHLTGMPFSLEPYFRECTAEWSSSSRNMSRSMIDLGHIPSDLKHMSPLTELYLQDNGLKGTSLPLLLDLKNFEFVDVTTTGAMLGNFCVVPH